MSKQVKVSKKDREELTRLQFEITEFANSTKLFQENEVQLKNAIDNQKKDQEEKFMEGGNPDFDAFTKLEDIMKQIGADWKNSQGVSTERTP